MAYSQAEYLYYFNSQEKDAMRLFIADDSKVMRDKIRELASGIKGIELVGEAVDVRTSIQGITDLSPDAVVLDIRMPGGSGLEVLRAIKKTLKRPVLIVLTNYPFPEYREVAVKLGADHFFDKATEFYEVQEVLEKMVWAGGKYPGGTVNM